MIDYIPDDAFMGSWKDLVQKQKAMKQKRASAFSAAIKKIAIKKPSPQRAATAGTAVKKVSIKKPAIKLVRNNFRSLIKSARMHGIDYDDADLMGAGIADLIKKIKSTVQDAKSLDLKTGSGGISLSKSGLSFTDTPDTGSGGQYQIQERQVSGIPDILKNPIFLGLAGFLAFRMLGRKK